MRLGICCGPQSVEGASLSERAHKLQDVLRDCRAAYFEMGVASVMGPDFDDLEAALAPLELKAEAFNSFVPAQFRLTGPEIDHDGALEYCATALERCRKIGGHVVVLGSAGARKVPEGFDKARAMEQFSDFCRRLGPVAADAGMMIAIEPLNHSEDNLILSVEAGARLVDEVDHPSIQLLADLYHMVLEGESVESVARAGQKMVHTHIASSSRVPPGTDPGDTAPYEEFFAACRSAGYDARCSYEGKLSDLSREGRILIGTLRAALDASEARA